MSFLRYILLYMIISYMIGLLISFYIVYKLTRVKHDKWGVITVASLFLGFSPITLPIFLVILLKEFVKDKIMERWQEG